MKKIIYILLLFSLTISGQEIIRPSSMYYGAGKIDSTLVRNRTSVERAIMDGVGYSFELDSLITDGFRTIKIKLPEYLNLKMPIIKKSNSFKKIQKDSTFLVRVLASFGDVEKRLVLLFDTGMSQTVETDSIALDGMVSGEFTRLNLRFYIDEYINKKYVTKIKRLFPDPEILELSNLRIEKVNGVPRIRITGTKPCTMYFEFSEEGSLDWFRTEKETSFNYSSHGYSETRIKLGKRYTIHAVGKSKYGLVVTKTENDLIIN
jgi:hypothetical protein